MRKIREIYYIYRIYCFYRIYHDFLYFCEKYYPYAKNARNFAIRQMAFIVINRSSRKMREMQEIRYFRAC